jgi:hypothetical protein
MFKGFVYILFNIKTNRVKVGMTGGAVMQRIREINRTNPDIEYFNGDKNLPLSFWQYRYSFKTSDFVEVEKLAHKYLNEYLDKEAPIGEVFNCSVDKAINAVEDALKDLDLLEQAERFDKETYY